MQGWQCGMQAREHYGPSSEDCLLQLTGVLLILFLCRLFMLKLYIKGIYTIIGKTIQFVVTSKPLM
jgi:hypothetical protein